MALWQIEHADTPWEQWDDGEQFKPGEEGFSTDAVRTHAGASPFNYMGTPNWQPPVEPIDEVSQPAPAGPAAGVPGVELPPG